MTATVRVNPSQLSRSALHLAAAHIRRGEVVAMPTDTVYGLAVDPFQPGAVRRLLRLKRRPETKPILLLVESLRQVKALAESAPESLDRLAARFWPGPLTVVLAARPSISALITAGAGTVAVRIPGSLLARELIRALGGPVTGTSANLSGRPAAQTAAQVRQQFPAGLALILDGGPARSAALSTIVDLTGTPRIIRQGAVPASAVLLCCPTQELSATASEMGQ